MRTLSFINEPKTSSQDYSWPLVLVGTYVSPRHLLISLALTCTFSPGEATSSHVTPVSDFSKVLNQARQPSQTITTDQEAQTVISSLLFDNKDQATAFNRKKSKKIQERHLPKELAQHGLHFIRATGIFHWASQFYNQLEQQPLSATRASYEEKVAFLSWIKGDPPKPEINRVLSLTETLLGLASHPRPPSEAWNAYWKFAQHTLDTYPDWTGSESGWVRVAEQKGAPEIIRRLESYWETDPFKDDLGSSESAGIREAYIGRFLHQQLIPIFITYLKASLLELQTRNEWRARDTWRHFQEWNIQQHERQDLARLCGTWQWLIHNHQNHGDHKTVMVYPPPSQYDRMVPKPATIRVQGDTVYIRWEFPNGIIQEESLLFSEKDRMLSGTFVNNMGPNGNITGRRVAPCKDR